MIPFDSCTDPDAEVLLNEYVDGELAAGLQPALFAHLAICGACRAEFEALLAFRLAVRSESLAVPPSVDAALFARLDRARRAGRKAPDRRAQRLPWGGVLRRRVSVGATLVVAAVAVVLGLASGPRVAHEPATPARLAPQAIQVFDTEGVLFVIDEPLAVSAERERTPRRR